MNTTTIRSLYRYCLMAAVRDRLLWSVLGVLAIVLSLSVFFGASALTERESFVMSFAAFGFRFFGVAALVLFVINHIRRSFDSRDIDFLLSRPIGRIGFVVTHSAAFSTLALLVGLFFGGVIVLLQMGNLHAGVFLWCVSLLAELIIMANVAMFFAFVMSSTTACILIVFCFYLLSRLIGEIIGILNIGSGGTIISFLGKIMEMISIVLPRLDLMSQTKWIVYGMPTNISFGFVIAQCGIFVTLIVLATAIDMRRRQF